MDSTGENIFGSMTFINSGKVVDSLTPCFLQLDRNFLDQKKSAPYSLLKHSDTEGTAPSMAANAHISRLK